VANFVGFPALQKFTESLKVRTFWDTVPKVTCVVLYGFVANFIHFLAVQKF